MGLAGRSCSRFMVDCRAFRRERLGRRAEISPRSRPILALAVTLQANERSPQAGRLPCRTSVRN